MITQTQMYWLTRLDAIHELGKFFGVLVMLCGIGVVFSLLAYMLINEEDIILRARKFMLGFTVGAVITLLTTIILCCFCPTTKEMAAILVVPRVLNNEKMQTVGNKVYGLAVEWMEELRPKNAVKDETKK